MRGWIVALIIALTAVLAVACGGDDDSFLESLLGLGEPALVGDLEVTVHGSREDRGGEALKPRQGSVWKLVEVSVRNNGEEDYDLEPLYRLVLLDRDGQAQGLTFGGPSPSGSLGGRLEPGEEMRGEIAFEVLEDAKGLHLVFRSDSTEDEPGWRIE
jgi:hypothetical protein